VELVLAVPNLNGARYLEATLRSLALNRPWVRWHFQDGGSTDASLDLALRYASPRDTVVSEPDAGQADALNRAFDRMGGDVVGFLNSDDCLADGAAQAVLEEFHRDPELDLLYGEVEVIDAQGAHVRTHRGHISSLAEILDIYEVWWGNRQWVQPEVFFRRRLWERVGPFDTRYRLAFDYDYWVRCFLAGAKVKRIPRVLARFRLHENQKSRAAVEAADEIRSIVGEALRKRPPISLLRAWKLARRLSYDRYQSGYDRRRGKARLSFAAALLSHPTWLAVPEVRQRIRISLSRRWLRAASG